jgi:hypothetical protein
MRLKGMVCLVSVVLLAATGCSSLMDYVGSLQEDESQSESPGTPPRPAESTQDSSEPGSAVPSSAPASTETTPAGPSNEEVAQSFAGCWQSNEWGWMRLESNGATVTGTYEHDEGRIEAVVAGAVLVGMWSEAPSYAPTNDAGQCEFTLQPDGQSFTGHWRYGSDGGWDGSWTAVRIQCAPESPSIPAAPEADRWHTNFGEMVLEFSGDRVSGEYEHDGGRIEGILSGRVITGTWSESPSYAPPNDAGQFEFTLSEDGRSFTGRWRYDSEGAWYDWSGTMDD